MSTAFEEQTESRLMDEINRIQSAVLHGTPLKQAEAMFLLGVIRGLLGLMQEAE